MQRCLILFVINIIRPVLKYISTVVCVTGNFTYLAKIVSEIEHPSSDLFPVVVFHLQITKQKPVPLIAGAERKRPADEVDSNTGNNNNDVKRRRRQATGDEVPLAPTQRVERFVRGRKVTHLVRFSSCSVKKFHGHFLTKIDGKEGSYPRSRTVRGFKSLTSVWQLIIIVNQCKKNFSVYLLIKNETSKTAKINFDST